MPLVGFLPASDERMQGTVGAIQRELTTDGFVARYTTGTTEDGLPPGEGVFLPCTFWLADNLALMGRVDEGRALFERLLGLANDVGLLAEEYDPVAKRQLGNFPQAFTHVSLVNSGCNRAGASPRSGPGLTRSLDPRRLPAAGQAGFDVKLDRCLHRDPAAAAHDRGGMERERPSVLARDLAYAATFVERGDAPAPATRDQWTILAIGSSMMPVAPCSLSAGISVLISDLATTASSA